MTPKEIVYDVLDDCFALCPSNHDTTLTALGLDSLDEVELGSALIDRLGEVAVAGSDIHGNTTIRELIDFVTAAQEQLNGKS